MHAYYIDYILDNYGKKLEFTDRAKTQIEKITKSGVNKYLENRAVQGGGCSGFKYNFSFDNKVDKDDILFNQTVIDKQSLNIIAGSTVDFKKEMIGESFVINNPKSLLFMWVWFVFFGLMKIISWNVNSVGARITNIQDYIKSENPDILLLQEIKTQDENFPYEDFKLLGYKVSCIWSKKL